MQMDLFHEPAANPPTAHSSTNKTIDRNAAIETQKLTIAIVSASNAIGLAGPLSDEDEDALDETITMMRSYPHSLQDLSSALMAKAHEFESRGDESKAAVALVAANSVANSLVTPIPNEVPDAGLKRIRLEIEPDGAQLLAPNNDKKREEIGMIAIEKESLAFVGGTPHGIPLGGVGALIRGSLEDGGSTLRAIEDRQKYQEGVEVVASALDRNDESAGVVLTAMRMKSVLTTDKGTRLGMEDALRLAEGFSFGADEEDRDYDLIKDLQFRIYDKASKQTDILGSKLELLADTLSSHKGDLLNTARYIARTASELKDIARNAGDISYSADAAALSMIAREITHVVGRQPGMQTPSSAL